MPTHKIFYFPKNPFDSERERETNAKKHTHWSTWKELIPVLILKFLTDTKPLHTLFSTNKWIDFHRNSDVSLSHQSAARFAIAIHSITNSWINSLLHKCTPISCWVNHINYIRYTAFKGISTSQLKAMRRHRVTIKLRTAFGLAKRDCLLASFIMVFIYMDSLKMGFPKITIFFSFSRGEWAAHFIKHMQGFGFFILCK